MKEPKAVLISDIHFTPATLELASKALIQARDAAIKLNIPLIMCGDTLDSKAIIRGECANRLIEILNLSKLNTIILIGNHDLLNEKSKEHSLNFLSPYAHIISEPQYDPVLDIYFIPYQSNINDLKSHIKTIPSGSTIIAHQGLKTAYMGHYVQDKTSIDPKEFSWFRTFSGHYHRSQTIECGESGLFTYIGTPYTTSFSEAHDLEKGFKILYNDNTLEHICTNLRRHRILEATTSTYKDLKPVNPQDLLFVKIEGPASELQNIDKKELGLKLLGHNHYRLDLINTSQSVSLNISNKVTNNDLFDMLIDTLSDSDKHKEYLKTLWKEIINESN